MADECIFCKIVTGEIPSTKVFEDETTYAFRDINAQAPTHILIVPKKHVPRLVEMQETDEALIGHIAYVAGKIAQQEGIGESFRLVINNGEGAGQSVFHIHFHLLGGRKLSWPPG
jgi:histidine triad (HIT) family protein